MTQLDPIDLTNCDREPIHIPGSIQPHGALLAVDSRDMDIAHAGGATAEFLGVTPGTLIGANLRTVLAPEQFVALFDMATTLSMRRPVPVFSMHSAANTGTVDVMAHRTNELIVLEFEPRRLPEPPDGLQFLQTMIRRVQRAESLQLLCDAITAEVRAASGFDRVMLYQLLPDLTGKVIAESCSSSMGSFLDLHYPASDIPSQARALYKSSWIRNIPDSNYDASLIVPPVGPESRNPLDLTHSILRSVSPMHRQYLANMGVAASLSLSIIIRGELWGLIACHHAQPRFLPPRLRDVFELFAEVVSSQIEMRLTKAHFIDAQHQAILHEELVAHMSRETDLAAGLIRYRPNLLDYIPAGGVALWIDGQFSSLGDALDEAQTGALVAWLNETAASGVFQTDSLPLLYAPAQEFANVASGLLAISVSRSPRDYVLWFRPELVRTVTWAGNPHKPVASAMGGPLTPRASFAAWEEFVRLRAAPWTAPEIEGAERLRTSLIEVILRQIDELARTRATINQQQSEFTAELDRQLARSQSTAAELQLETERRAVLESELVHVLRRTVTDQEADRLRIARELHDTLGQSLTLVRLALEDIDRADTASPEVRARTAEALAQAAAIGRQVSQLAWEIRPIALDDLGLETAIRQPVETWSERTGKPYDLHLTLSDQRLPEAVETCLYRVLQEALTNIVRHADATRVAVVLGAADGIVSMIIEDDGNGFAQQGDAGSGSAVMRLGLLGMRERLAQVNGMLEIESAPGQGTSLFIRVPL